MYIVFPAIKYENHFLFMLKLRGPVILGSTIEVTVRYVMLFL